MDDEAALLRAVCESPDEDTPRLVFADYLQEQGGAVNVAWALGIRAQIAVACGNADELTLQRVRVLDAGSSRWRVLARLGLSTRLNVSEWTRGFPAAVADDFAAVAADWPAIAHRVPVRALHFDVLLAAHAAAFVAWPGLERVRELTLHVTGDETGDVLPRLAACPGLCGLEVLNVQNSALTEGDAVALLRSPYLVGLKVLDADYGWARGALPAWLEGELVARFGPGVVTDGGDVIPF